jgi:hypothetical protein
LPNSAEIADDTSSPAAATTTVVPVKSWATVAKTSGDAITNDGICSSRPSGISQGNPRQFGN